MQVRLALVGSDCDPPTVTAIQSTTNLGMLLGPAVSGVAIAHVGVQNVLFLDAATFLVSTLCLIPIRMRHGGRYSGYGCKENITRIETGHGWLEVSWTGKGVPICAVSDLGSSRQVPDFY